MQTEQKRTRICSVLSGLRKLWV